MSTAPPVLPHVDAVTAALTAQPNPLTVSLGAAPPGVLPPYCVLYPDPGQSVPASLGDPVGYFTGTLQVTCVGETAEQALSVSDRVRARLSMPLIVAGRSGWRPEELASQPVRRDDDVTPPLFYATAQFRLRSTPS